MTVMILSHFSVLYLFILTIFMGEYKLEVCLLGTFPLAQFYFSASCDQTLSSANCSLKPRTCLLFQKISDQIRECGKNVNKNGNLKM